MKQDTKNTFAAILAAAQAKAAQQTEPIKPAAPAPVTTPEPEPEPNKPELSNFTIEDIFLPGYSPDEETETQTNPEPATMPQPATKQPETSPNTLQIVDYSDRAFAVIGETKPVKDQLKALGGRFNMFLKCGAGWIFPKPKLSTVKANFNL